MKFSAFRQRDLLSLPHYRSYLLLLSHFYDVIDENESVPLTYTPAPKVDLHPVLVLQRDAHLTLKRLLDELLPALVEYLIMN